MEAIAAYGHNSGEVEEEARDLDRPSIATALLVRKTLKLLCAVIEQEDGALDPGIVILKRQGGEKTIVRNACLYLLRATVPVNQLATIFNLYRGTVADGIDEIKRFCDANGLVSETFDMLDQMFEPLKGIMENLADGFLSDLMAEKKADLALIEAKRRLRHAVDKLDREGAEEIARIQIEANAKHKAAWDARLARINASVEEKARKPRQG